ncbi:MFS transporter [Xanthobacter sp. KR7-225]|uniref:MFS transporter n=1 Tax=Xanthobacter sp. KR7-225 TaxID=3156613 RepID=UPI0032B46A69
MSGQIARQAEAASAADDRVPLTRLHLLAVFVCALGLAVDVAELALGGVLSAVFSAPPHAVSRTELSWLLAAAYAGAVIGAPAFGWLADRHGRRALLFAALVTLALASAAAAASANVGQLALLRLLGGVALGAYPPLMFAYLSELLPPVQRGRLLMVSVAIAGLGPVALVFAVHGLTPLAPLGIEGWRWGFLLGSLGAGLCSLLFLLLPESPYWLARREARACAADAGSRCRPDHVAHLPAGSAPSGPEGAPQGGTAASPSRSRGGLAFVVACFFLTPWAVLGFQVLGGAVLVHHGFSLGDSLLLVGVFTFGPVAGALLGSVVIDRVERRTLVVASAGTLAIVALAFGFARSLPALTASGVAFGVLASALLPAFAVYAAELFPTDQRAGAISCGWAANRVGSALVPIVLLPILDGSGPAVMFAVIAATLVALAVLVAMRGPLGRSGRALG